MRSRRSRGRQRAGAWGPGGLGLGVGLAVGLAVGCISVEPFQCQNDADCVFEGQPGKCRLVEQTCIYPDPACPSQWGTADGECTPLSGESGMESGLSTGAGGTGSGESGGSGDSGDSETGMPEPPGCGSTGHEDLTGQGDVWASSVFRDQYPAELAVDGDYTTSWLSAGFDAERAPSVFRWTASETRCVARVAVIGNAMHQNPEYREGYGFGSVIMRLFDEDQRLVYQQMFDLAGTPDPDVIAEPGVLAVRIELELFDHENFYSGGFSELEIAGY